MALLLVVQTERRSALQSPWITTQRLFGPICYTQLGTGFIGRRCLTNPPVPRGHGRQHASDGSWGSWGSRGASESPPSAATIERGLHPYYEQSRSDQRLADDSGNSQPYVKRGEYVGFHFGLKASAMCDSSRCPLVIADQYSESRTHS